MSFVKKINIFLDKAFLEGAVDQNTKVKLQNFAENYERKSISSFASSISYFGGFTIILGIISIISSNWDKISDFTKISTYIALLIGFHISAYLLRTVSPKISQIIYFIIAGYILAGIGLIAQIYNLSSKNGEAYLIWFLLIAPMAIIHRNSRIGLIAIISLYYWVNINANFNFYHFLIDSWQSQLLYSMAILSSAILIPRTFTYLSYSFDQIKLISYLSIGITTFLMGFAHDILPKEKLSSILLHPITIVIIVLNVICLTNNFIKNFRDRKKLVDIIQLPEFVIVILNIIPLFIFVDYKLLISISYWIIWFWSCGVMIYRGEIEKNKTMINIGTWCVIIGIIARFIDLIGTMLFTGSMFILFGIALISIAYIGEKYRKNLINKVFKNHVIQK
jgi:uncharacterized membrane protein